MKYLSMSVLAFALLEACSGSSNPITTDAGSDTVVAIDSAREAAIDAAVEAASDVRADTTLDQHADDIVAPTDAPPVNDVTSTHDSSPVDDVASDEADDVQGTMVCPRQCSADIQCARLCPNGGVGLGQWCCSAGTCTQLDVCPAPSDAGLMCSPTECTSSQDCGGHEFCCFGAPTPDRHCGRCLAVGTICPG